jgi:hypothetical protein
MTKKQANRAALVVLLMGVIPAHAAAQNQSDYSRLNAERGAELSLFGGATAAATGAAPAFGWSAGWRASARVALEGSGSWVSEPGVDGFAALFGARVYLNTASRSAPFVTVEGGLFHASVDGSDSRAPDFYLDRTVPGFTEKAFNDFVAAAGGGVDVHVGGPLWLRPDARLLVVVDGWRANVLMLAGFHFTYRFSGAPGSPSATPKEIERVRRRVP